MIPWDRFDALLGDQIESAWQTLGVPRQGAALIEKRSGIIDPEALLVATLLSDPGAELRVHVAAWLWVRQDLVSHQKLRNLFAALPERQQGRARGESTTTPFAVVGLPFRKVLGLGPSRDSKLARSVESRAKDLAPLATLADASAVLKNRLLFGTGFRADIVSVLQTRHPYRLRGRELADLVAAAGSTVSRILRDLRACGYLDGRNRPRRRQPTYPRLYISAQTVRNLATLFETRSPEGTQLEEQAVAGLDLEEDGLLQHLLSEPRAHRPSGGRAPASIRPQAT